MNGFNDDEVRVSINAINSAYDALMVPLADNMQSKFIGELSTRWASPIAQKFFAEFNTVANKLLTDSYSTFQNIVDVMDSAATAWAKRTGVEYSKIGFKGASRSVDVSSIQENINGVSGAMDDAGSVATNALNDIASFSDNALTSAENAVRNCGFVGKGQQENLLQSLTNIKNQANKAITELTNTVSKAITDTTEAHKDTATKVASAFTAK